MPSLTSSLLEALGEGCLAGIACGAIVAVDQPQLQELLLAQQDLLVGLSAYLFICAQIGAATSLLISFIPSA
jgi:hypothetical protein